MSAAEQGSARRSDRVELPAARPTEATGSQPNSAPGSTASAAPLSRSPEGRRASSERRLTRRRVLLTEQDLSPRDQAILRAVQQYRFLSTRHLEGLFFWDHATAAAGQRIARRSLQRLSALRVIEPLERRLGGIRAGSASYVWRVGLLGDQLLRLRAGQGPRARRKEPSSRFLDHCLAIADIGVSLTTNARTDQLDLLQLDTEPTCWRRYTGSGGSREILKPDLAAVTASSEFEDHWFIEVDRASESLPTLIRKCHQYADYRRTGREQHDGGVFPLVLWVVPDDHRAGQLRTALRLSNLDTELFRICTMADVLPTITGSAA